MTLIAATILSACSSMPQNPSLSEAHHSYNNARTNPEVIDMAEPELIAADESINDADHAVRENQSSDIVNHLAYIAKQKVAIAEETAKWKATELAFIDAAIKNYLTRRLIKMNTAEAARQQAGISQQAVEADRQAAELTVTGIDPEHNQTQNAQQEMQLKALNAEKTDGGLLITLSDVSFHTNQAQLDSSGMRNVQKLADFLNQYPQYEVSIEGLTDSIGSNNVNRQLSDRRAYAVRKTLNDMGISDDRIKMHGYINTFPATATDVTTNNQLNRRVEIVLSPR